MRWPGFEPGLRPWQGHVIPLHYQRARSANRRSLHKNCESRGGIDARTGTRHPERNFKGWIGDQIDTMDGALAIETFALAELPLAWVDQVLLDYHVGHVLIVMFVLVMLAAVPLRSPKVLSLNVVAFGLIFVLTPFWVVEGYDAYIYAGIAMIVVGTMAFAYAES